MFEWFVVCLYIASFILLMLSFRFLFSMFKLTLWFPVSLSNFIISLFLSILFFITANQISSFFVSDRGLQIAEITIKENNIQKFTLSISSPSQSDKAQFAIDGDEWQLDMRIITWNNLLSAFGLNTLYRFERISGRYISMENSQKLKHSMYPLKDKNITDFLWTHIASLYDGSVFRAYYGLALFAPMSDKAKYGLFLTSTGAEVLPLNEYAKQSLKAW